MIPDRLRAIRSRIDAACVAAGRDPADVRLVAVSKTKPSSMIREAYAAGQRDFGENYAQELRDKAAELVDLTELRWHFIGHLQRNKVKYVAKASAQLVHAVDSVKLGMEIAKRQPGASVLVEVNIGGEQSKHGVTPADTLALAGELDALPGLTCAGLMCIPPPGSGPESFAALGELFAAGQAQGLPFTELSMGMSGDFEDAIAHGATLVRVGTAIFGARNPVKSLVGALKG
ncbi:MAG: YggS family pyridoxal phosphate-dependent enzyme [Proteobacteria bacterium]|nr:YggS family pyridoxal phosphate-dependent enzyme [Pseudomonadota bacterium]MCP4919877.1 YggS family pyridoxal phosphate-dependent enzyme [Pseudomonadota bacterium]